MVLEDRGPTTDPTPPQTPAGLVLLDGTYFQSWCLLIAFDGGHVLDWQWCDHEKKIAWQQILARQPASRSLTGAWTGRRAG